MVAAADTTTLAADAAATGVLQSSNEDEKFAATDVSSSVAVEAVTIFASAANSNADATDVLKVGDSRTLVSTVAVGVATNDTSEVAAAAAAIIVAAASAMSCNVATAAASTATGVAAAAVTTRFSVRDVADSEPEPAQPFNCGELLPSHDNGDDLFANCRFGNGVCRMDTAQLLMLDTVGSLSPTDAS